MILMDFISICVIAGYCERVIVIESCHAPMGCVHPEKFCIWILDLWFCVCILLDFLKTWIWIQIWISLIIQADLDKSRIFRPWSRSGSGFWIFSLCDCEFRIQNPAVVQIDEHCSSMFLFDWWIYLSKTDFMAFGLGITNLSIHRHQQPQRSPHPIARTDCRNTFTIEWYLYLSTKVPTCLQPSLR